MSLRQRSKPTGWAADREQALLNLWCWFVVGLLGAVGGFIAALNDDPAMWVVTPIALVAMARCAR